ncbi:hypothetical protein LSH36_1881g00012 [Paralvinella palmiformis]|uniref:EGF-like domain-containing protein n=1 Tax=Paralvinella palmiformis TaxID=53620 RepID=A0AAD9IQX2_9ANNE|nr:hypothetical protein LSH36_1881g00012 [Paralvinella palmiformis]
MSSRRLTIYIDAVKTPQSGKYLKIGNSFHNFLALAEEEHRRFTTIVNESPHLLSVQPKCQKYPWKEPNGELHLVNDDREYFRKTANNVCYVVGTDFSVTNSSAAKCECQTGWYGIACSIPDSVWKSKLRKPHLEKIEPRLSKWPRKLIHAFPFNNEFEFLEARIAEYHDVVDVFMILESNYTANGSAKPLYLLNRLKSGYIRQYACKIIHVFLDYFPDEGIINGWIIDDLLRDYLSQHGLKHQLKNYNSEDIFFMTDADELPRKQTVAIQNLLTSI